MARNSEIVGKTILFYGCRKRSEDFLYEKEWEVSLHNPRNPSLLVFMTVDGIEGITTTKPFRTGRNTSLSLAILSTSLPLFRANPRKRSTCKTGYASTPLKSTSCYGKRPSFTFVAMRPGWRAESVRRSLKSSRNTAV